MSDESRKIIVDDDWKAQAQREKEKLSEQQAATKREPVSDASFGELLQLMAMQVLAGLGMVAGPGGQPIPPNMPMAKHFIDMLQMLEAKTKGNLSDEEKKALDRVLYEVRTYYVQQVSAMGGAGVPQMRPAPAAGGGPGGAGVFGE
jgi:Domain of unknown function (DUF1844)